MLRSLFIMVMVLWLPVGPLQHSLSHAHEMTTPHDHDHHHDHVDDSDDSDHAEAAGQAADAPPTPPEQRHHHMDDHSIYALPPVAAVETQCDDSGGRRLVEPLRQPTRLAHAGPLRPPAAV